MTNKVKVLEGLTIDKIQALERPTNENKENTQIQTKEFRAKPIIPLHYETEKEQLKVSRKSTLVYPVTLQEGPLYDKHPQGYAEIYWNPVEMLDYLRFKDAVISYGMHLPFVKQMLNS